MKTRLWSLLISYLDLRGNELRRRFSTGLRDVGVAVLPCVASRISVESQISTDLLSAISAYTVIACAQVITKL